MSRLIDADALFREMEKAQWYNNADRDEIAEELVLNAPTIEPEPQIIHCNKCKHYQGVHKVQGHAPCNYWGTGAVLWNEYCSKAEPYREGES